MAGNDKATGFEQAMSARLTFLVLAPATAGVMYVATFASDWQWHPFIAAAGVVGVTFLGLRAILKKPANPKAKGKAR